MKNWKKYVLALLVIVLAAASYGYYLYNKKPADVRLMEANYKLTATALLNEYNKDEAAANIKYLDKVIEVEGTVAEIKLDPENGQASVILDTGDPMAAITCSFYNEEAASVKKLTVRQVTTIKGKCTGKLMDVVLNRCSIK